jgi:VWFA-related protein
VIVAPNLVRGAMWSLALAALAGVFQAPAPAPQFAARTDLVEVYVSVEDASGHPIDHLLAPAFHVLDNGLVQPVAVFAGGSLPLALAVIVDRSFSMRGGRLAAARAGALRMLDDLRSDDRVTVLAVGSDVETVASPEATRETAREAVRALAPWGSSPLTDAVSAALGAVRMQPGRRAVVLFTDGEDRYDVTTRRDVLDAVRRGDSLAYSVAVGKAEPPLLQQLAEMSGGRVSLAREAHEAAAAAAAIMADLRHQYVVGFAPPGGPPGWHSITVTVDSPDARVRARQGYVQGPTAEPGRP